MTAAKPRIHPLPKTGDANVYLVDGRRVVVSGCLQAVRQKHPLALLGEELAAQAAAAAALEELAESYFRIG